MSCRVLIVDDDVDKIRVLTSAIYGVEGYSAENVDTVTDATAAKNRIASRKYDLVVLDINLRPSADRASIVGGGLAVINYIKNNRRAIQPTYILGTTAFDDGASVAANVFSSPLWKLIRFDFRDGSWREPLQEALRFLNEKDRPPYYNDGATFHTHIGIFVALEGVEWESILALPCGWQETKVEHDATTYMRGYIDVGSRKLSIVLAAAPKMGLPSAAVSASKLISAFRPKYLAITGICAGVRGKARIGDILIADPCFDWGSGKWIEDGTRKQLRFLPAPYPWRLDDTIRSTVRRLGNDANLLSNLHVEFVGKKSQRRPRLLVDAMASGGSVLQSKLLMNDVRGQHKNLVGVEMESYSVFTAAENAATPRPLCVSIKSVCDYGDSSKTDGYQRYAAHCSAGFLYALASCGFGDETLGEQG